MLVTAGGCAATVPDRNAWITAHGGVVSGPLQAQADAAMSRLTPLVSGKIRVRVLDSEAAGAFSWPDGTVFVNRRLVEALNDQELSATICHELGHLLNDGHLQGVASLHGCCVSPDKEAKADATGVQILRRSGIDPRAMRSMLMKIDALVSDAPNCSRAIKHRIDLLAASDTAP